jgi:hypothetical protein
MAFLAFGLMTISPEQAFQRASTVLGWNGAVIAEIAKNRASAIVGFAGLATGFVLQVVGYALALEVGWAPGRGHATDAFLAAGFAGLGACLAAAVLWPMRQGRLRGLLWELACFDVDTGILRSPTPNMDHLAHYAELAGFHRGPHEDDEAYIARVFRRATRQTTRG